MYLYAHWWLMSGEGLRCSCIVSEWGKKTTNKAKKKTFYSNDIHLGITV